jgi:CheY-like chemotaxis protein
MNLEILLVEDHPINQKMAAALLKKLGFSVDVASNGVEAVDMHHAKSYVGIIMDIQMPIMDGFEATTQIRSSNETIPIIALTGNPDHDFEQQMKNLKMNGYLKKPIDIEHLTTTLKAVIPAYI